MSLSSLLPAPLNKVFDKDDEKTVVKGKKAFLAGNSSELTRNFCSKSRCASKCQIDGSSLPVPSRIHPAQ